MKPKTLSKIISFSFILTFAFLGGISSVMNTPFIPGIDYFIDYKPSIKSDPIPPPGPTQNYPMTSPGNKSMPEYKTKPMAPPTESFTPPENPQIPFYVDPNFWFRSTVTGIFGYILKHIFDFISGGLRALSRRLF